MLTYADGKPVKRLKTSDNTAAKPAKKKGKQNASEVRDAVFSFPLSSQPCVLARTLTLIVCH